MKDELDYELLITPQEAIKLAMYRPIKDIFICNEIKNHLQKSKTKLSHIDFETVLMVTIWNGGRLQGIREEQQSATGGTQ